MRVFVDACAGWVSLGEAVTFILGPSAGAGGTVPVTGSWAPRAAAVAAMPKVVQPFSPAGG